MRNFFARVRRTQPAKLHTIPCWNVWDKQDFFVRAKEKHTMPGIPDIRCYFLQSALRSLRDLPGDVVECGVREGKSSFFMMEACERERQFFLFDSFEGLSDPHPSKDTWPSAIEKDGKRWFAVDFQTVSNRLSTYDCFHVLKGWIPERFKEVENRRFCLVHIDVDLYQPTRDSLAFFYPRLHQHGIIVCDDYGSGHFSGARAAFDEFFADKAEKPIELPQAQCLIVKR
jgi:O-methyltransferase